MPAQLIGSNLNTFGNSGNFETDPSTWGFGGDSSYSISRSTEQKTKGSYAAKLVLTTGMEPGGFFNFRLTVKGRVNVQSGKKYIAKCKVYTPSSNVLGNATLSISIGVGLGIGLVETEGYGGGTNPVECTNTWIPIQWRFKLDESAFTGSPPGFYQVAVQIAAGTFTGTGEAYAGGILFVDEFEIYEYTGEGEEGDPPDPEPEPNPYEIDKIFHHRNPITLTKTAEVGWDVITNYRLYNEVKVEDNADSAIFNSKLKVDLQPDVAGNVVFYLEEAFRDVLTAIPPIKNASTIVRLTDRVKRFRNYSGKVTGTAYEPADELDESLNNLVVYGGISKEKFPGLNYFSDYLPTNKKFLTWAPVIKEVDRLQEDYLNFFIYDSDIATIKLRLKVYFDDGTDQTSISQTKTGTKYTELYQIPAGPTNSGALLVNPVKNVTHYELSLLDQDDVVVSEVRTYYVVKNRHTRTRFFLWLNSLGSYEVIRFTGVANSKTDYTREVVQKILPHNYAAQDGEFEVNYVSMEKQSNYSSGFVQQDWHEYLQDFLLSKRIYDITSGDRIPVIIKGSDHSAQDQNYEFYIRFDAKPAYDNESFTPSTI